MNRNLEINSLGGIKMLRRIPAHWLLVLLIALGSVWWSGSSTVGAQTETQNGLLGEYYDGINFDTFAFSRIDPVINSSAGPGNGLSSETFSIRWTGYLIAPETATYTISVQHDDGMRVWLDNVNNNDTPIIDQWIITSPRWSASQTIELIAGQEYPIRVEYFENYTQNVYRLAWSYTLNDGTNIARTIIPTENLTPSIDSDSDGLTDFFENTGIKNVNYNNETTLPNNPDSDGDGLNDGDEILIYGSNPNATNSDVDSWLDGQDNCPADTNEDQADYDNDGQGDACEPAIGSVTLTFDTDTVAADGSSPITGTVTVFDSANPSVPLRNTTVEITVPQGQSEIILSDADEISTENSQNITGITDENGVYTFTVVSPIVAEAILIQAIASSTLANSGIAQETVNFTGPNLGVSVTGLDTVVAGQMLIYAIDIDNSTTENSDTATDIGVFAGLPLGIATIDSIVLPTDGSVTVTGQGSNSVEFTIDELVYGQSRRIYVYARTAANLQAGGVLSERRGADTITLDASIDSATNGDTDPSNNVASFTTSIRFAAAATTPVQETKLTVTYTPTMAGVPITQAALGDVVTFEVTVANITANETIYNVEGFAALKDTFATAFNAASMLVFTWPDADNPGVLQPGEVATATFDYTMVDAYRLLGTADPARDVRISANDSDPSDGSEIVVFKTLEETDFTHYGPNLQVELIADNANPRVGDTVNFTVRALNASPYTEAVEGLEITNLQDVSTLLSLSTSLLPDNSVQTASFSYTIQASDAPSFTTSVRVRGCWFYNQTPNSDCDPQEFAIERVVQRTLAIDVEPIPTAPDLSVVLDSPTAMLFSNTTAQFDLALTNLNSVLPQNATLRLTLPENVHYVAGASGTYNSDTRTITWSVNDVTLGVDTIIPLVLDTTADVGATISLAAVIVNDLEDADYSNNSLTLNLPVVEATPTLVALEYFSNYEEVTNPNDSNNVPAPLYTEGPVQITGDSEANLRVTVTDQLGQPMAGLNGMVSSNGGMLTFKQNAIVISAFTTDTNGVAEIVVNSMQPGLDVAYVDFSGVGDSISVQTLPNALTSTLPNYVVGVGSSITIELSLLNTTNSGESFDLNVVGSGTNPLNTAWVTETSQDELIASGQSKPVSLTIDVPEDNNLCTLNDTGTAYEFTVTATDSNNQNNDMTIDLVLIVVNGASTITEIYPQDDTTIGVNADTNGDGIVTFSWRSATIGASEINIKEATASSFTTYPMNNVLRLDANGNPIPLLDANNNPVLDANNDPVYEVADATYFTVDVPVQAGANYVWYGSFTNTCGTTIIEPATDVDYTFTATNDVAFVSDSYNYTVEDDYDTRVDANGNPLAVSVVNNSPEARDIFVTLDNPYEDLIVGFTGAGSVDGDLTIPSGETATLNLRMFSQELTEESYTITLNLSNTANDSTDSVPLTIAIDSVHDFNVAITHAVLDSQNLVIDAKLENLGDTLTDLQLQVIDGTTGLPADFIILPNIEHTYLPAGSEPIPIEIVPLTILSDDVIAQENLVIRATSRWGVIESVPVTNVATQTVDLTQQCTIERRNARTCVASAGTSEFESSGSYCTNTPNIELTIPWSLNSEVPISNIDVSMSFSRGSGLQYNHSTELFFNNVSLGGGIVPAQSQLDFEAPLDAVVVGANYQTLNLRSYHTNGGHYTVGSDATITVTHGQYLRTACYSDAELNDATVFPCGADGVCETDVTISDLQLALDENNPNQINGSVRVGNSGTLDLNPGIVIGFYDGNPQNNISLESSPGQAYTVATGILLEPGDYEVIEFSLALDTTQAVPLYLKVDADDMLVESDEANNIYNTGIPLSPDLTVGAVNVSNLTVDPNSLATTGTISAVINSDVDIPLTFDVLFYEDIDVNDGGFNSAIDNILSTESVSSISGGIPYIVTTEPSDTLQFVNAPINVFVDSGEVIIESNENNNVASSTSSNLPDLTASHLTQVNNGTNATITVRVGNGGGAVAPAGISVAFFDQDPNSGATPLETTTVNMSIASGTYEEVTVVVPLPASPEVSRLWVWVDNTETIDETNELNNVYLSNQYLTQVTNAAPVVTVGTSVTVTEGSEVVDGVLSLEATVTDDNLPMGMLTTQWTVELGEPNAVIFDSIDEVDTTVTFTVAGTYTLRLTADDGALNDYAEIDVTYIVPPPPPLPSYYLDIDGCIASPLPLSGENLTPLMGVVDIELESTVNLIDAAVYYWPSYDPQQYMLLGSGLSVTGGGTIATFDTTALANGSYGLQVVGTDPSTDERVVCGVGVVVGGEYKPGRVVLSTTDFTVPLAGMPITVGRTYDSLERNIEGDFGYGWNLSIADPRLEVDDSNNVTLTLPSGERKTFYWTPMGNGFVQSLGTPHYTSELGEYGTLTAESCELVTIATSVCFPGNLYGLSVQSFTYEDPYGRQFTYSTDGELESIVDLNGNELQFEDDGIYSNAISATEPVVSITRDAQGRITQIEDSEGQVYEYQYSTVGDLIAVVLPDMDTVIDPTIRYTYYTEAQGLAHFFKDGVDPRGNAVVGTTYDDNGRLETVTDADGNTTSYSYDVSVGSTTVTNPDGSTMTMTYDVRGNLMSETDELGRTTSYTYADGTDNVLTITNDLGQTTTYAYDAQGNRTSVTNDLGIVVISANYNTYGAPETLTDANGIARDISYDSTTGMPLSASDPLGTIGSYTWNTQGSPLTVTDANGATTSYTYDDYGNVLTQTAPATDAGANQMTYTYDDMGRRITATDVYNTVTTTTYDNLGNVTQTITTASGGSVLAQMSYEYDANGNRTAMIDADGNRTEYVYDGNNRVTRVTMPDDTYTTTQYDWRGNVTAEIQYSSGDVILGATCYQYDNAGQLTHVTQHCTSVTGAPSTFVPLTTRYKYDPAGRRQETYMPWYGEGHPDNVLTSFVEYDDAGRVSTTTDVAGATTTYTYDDAGQLIAVTDHLQRTTQYSYDERGRRVRIIYPDSTWVTTEYDPVGRVINQIDAIGTETTTTYDAIGNVVSTTRAVGTSAAQLTSYEYDVLGRRTSMTDALEHTTTYVYDDLGRIDYMCDATVETCTAGVATANYTYNLLGQQEQVTDARGYTTSYIYDDMGRLEKITYADGTIEEFSYNGRGQRVSSTYDSTYTTGYYYDDMGRLIGICDASVTVLCRPNELDPSLTPFTTHYTYDARGRQIEMVDEDNTVTRMVYDDANRMTHQIQNYMPPDGVSDPLSYIPAWTFDGTNWTDGTYTIDHDTNNDHNIVTYYGYDALGRRTSMTDVTGNVTAYTYDNRNRLVTTTHPDSTSVSYAYDARGQRTAMTDENNLTTSYTYDPLGRLNSVTNPENERVRYNYDAMGRMLGITNGNGATTSFSYDEIGRLATKTWAMGETQSYTYDDNGNLTQVIREDNTVDLFTYDNMNRLTYEVYGNNTLGEVTYGYAYDSRGLLTTVYDVAPNLATPANTLTTYTYDALGRPTDVTHSDGQSIHYGYDVDGDRTSLETRINNVVETQTTYTYDGLNRVQSVTDSNTAQTTFAYNTVGLLTTIAHPNGVTTDYSYDPDRYFVTDIDHSNSGVSLGSYDYTYDDVGNRTSMSVTMSDGAGGTEIDAYTYAYDDANRLIEESYLLVGGASIDTDYQYDRAGNRTRMTVNDTEITRYTYNANDELTQILHPNYVFEKYIYDERGNLERVEYGLDDIFDTPTSWVDYTYNAQDQMTAMSQSMGASATYAYDHVGNRIAETNSTATTHFLWDEFSQYRDVVLETRPDAQTSDLVHYRDYTLANGMLISQTNVIDETHYFLGDAQNSTVALADTTGTVSANDRFSYSAFGELISDNTTLNTNYLYTGQYLDASNSDLYNLRARMYDPTLGRFTSRDTWAYDYQNPFELNRYVYTANNPATFVDPSGYQAATTYGLRGKDTGNKVGILTKFGKLVRDNYLVSAIGIYLALWFVINQGVEIDTDRRKGSVVEEWYADIVPELIILSGSNGSNSPNNNPDWWNRLRPIVHILFWTVPVACLALCVNSGDDTDDDDDDEMRILYHGTQTEITEFSLEEAIANQRETHITDRENPGIFFTDDLTRAASGYGINGWTIRVEVPKNIADRLCRNDDGALGTRLPEWIFRTPTEIAYLNATFDIKTSIEALRTWFLTDPLSKLQRCPVG